MILRRTSPRVTATPAEIPGQLMLPLQWPDPVTPTPPTPPEPDLDRWRLLWSIRLDRWLIYPPGASAAGNTYDELRLERRQETTARQAARAHVERAEVTRRTTVLRWLHRVAGPRHVVGRYHVAVTAQIPARDVEYYIDKANALRSRRRLPRPE